MGGSWARTDQCRAHEVASAIQKCAKSRPNILAGHRGRQSDNHADSRTGMHLVGQTGRESDGRADSRTRKTPVGCSIFQNDQISRTNRTRVVPSSRQTDRLRPPTGCGQPYPHNVLFVRLSGPCVRASGMDVRMRQKVVHRRELGCMRAGTWYCYISRARARKRKKRLRKKMQIQQPA